MDKNPVIAVHNGRFHTDDVFAVATIALIEGDVKIIRTRDEENFKTADYAIDVGCEYDPSRKRFDHHQQGGAGTRESGTPYASFGLVWKTYGKTLCGTDEAAAIIEKKLVEPIDMLDNGVPIYEHPLKVYPYAIQDIIFSFGATWKDEKFDFDSAFLPALEMAKQILSQEIRMAKATVEGLRIFDFIYQRAEDKRILILDKHYPYDDVMKKYPDTLFIVRPSPQSGDWKAETVTENLKDFVSRKMFPQNWAGKQDEKLIAETGVSDAVFCHNGRFLVIAKTKEGALALAKLAL
ncbi:MAG: MYG1 family protein [Candidatus Pacebacteria bacterium]|nr:MYG1 family protein [Candidatus Paceibacterota bacterium]